LNEQLKGPTEACWGMWWVELIAADVEACGGLWPAEPKYWPIADGILVQMFISLQVLLLYVLGLSS